jgi:hypothetical protein
LCQGFSAIHFLRLKPHRLLRQLSKPLSIIIGKSPLPHQTLSCAERLVKTGSRHIIDRSQIGLLNPEGLPVAGVETARSS